MVLMRCSWINGEVKDLKSKSRSHMVSPVEMAIERERERNHKISQAQWRLHPPRLSGFITASATGQLMGLQCSHWSCYEKRQMFEDFKHYMHYTIIQFVKLLIAIQH